jgi:hypothetical protein
MHLQFDSKESAFEYIEVNTRAHQFPFVYNKRSKDDMKELQQIQQEAIHYKSFDCSIGANPYIMGNYSLE